MVFLPIWVKLATQTTKLDELEMCVLHIYTPYMLHLYTWIPHTVADSASRVSDV